MAETLLAKEKINEALEAFVTAKESAPRWRNDYSYASWQKTMTDLEKKLNKKIK
jgi:hypothetical protein